MADDPRKAGGWMHDPTGDPKSRGTVQLDMRNAVLLGEVEVAMVDLQSGGESKGPALALELAGRINKTQENVTILYLLNEDGAAAIVSQLIALASRIGPEFRERLLERVGELLAEDAV